MIFHKGLKKAVLEYCYRTRFLNGFDLNNKKKIKYVKHLRIQYQRQIVTERR